MSWPSIGGRRSLTRLLSALGLLGSAWLAWSALERPRTTYELKVTGGQAPTTKHRLAEALRDVSEESGVMLEVVPFPGSIEALDNVALGSARGGVDVALVQGGLDSGRWGDVRQVAALDIEPLQLAVRANLADAVEENPIALQGMTVNLGKPGSGTEVLARKVLEFADLDADNPDRSRSYDPQFLSQQELEEIREEFDVPDAVFAVSSVPTEMIQHLVKTWRYRLVSLPFGKAFTQANLIPVGKSASGETRDGKVRIDGVHLRDREIPAFSYGLVAKIPPTPLRTFGARVLVVANVNVRAEAVSRLLEVIYGGKFAEVAIPPLDPSLLDEPPEFPLHPGTVEFQRRNKPLIYGDAIEFLEKTSSLTVSLLGGLFVAWRWALRLYRRRREIGFETYLLKVTAIEQEALRLELSSRLELAALLELQGDLGKLKQEALGRFTNGELEGEGLMSSFLTHANDARDYLARLILHARSAIEKQARRQGLAPEDAWALAIGGEDRPADVLVAGPHDQP